jgi:hypothetical protein
MLDEMLITLWLTWRGFYYWSMVALLALGATFALACFAKIQLPQADLFEKGWFKAATWVPVFGGGINWGLGKWVGAVVFGTQ